MKKLFSLSALLMLAMCAGFVSSCNDDVEETPPATVTPSDGSATENKDNHEYVDLGLPSGTLWATCNVGASKPEEYGDYFAWGETEFKYEYNKNTYKYCNGTAGKWTKYCTRHSEGSLDNKMELEFVDDAASINWGISWQMPSIKQFNELINSNYTTTTWTSLNGKYGCKITSKSNGMSIFLPATGYYSNTNFAYAGTNGRYWSRTLYPYNNGEVYYLLLSENGLYTENDHNERTYGLTVRPVRVKK